MTSCETDDKLVTRLGDFLKFMTTNLLTKVAQKRLATFGLIWKPSINIKTDVDII